MVQGALTPVQTVAWIGLSTLSLIMTGVVACCCDLENQQQQQQQQVVLDDDGPKRVCPECGIQNPREASYCGDCGYNFTPDKKENDE